MSFFTKTKPTLVVDGANTLKHITALEALNNLTDAGIKLRDNELKLLNIGLKGEKQILFELLNSNIPMYIFHDVYYEWGNLNAQIDFVVVTEQKVFIIECKNMVGNVIINDKGDFIREYNDIKEGMYSPVTQNKRHIDLLCNLILANQNLVGKFIKRNIINDFESIVVFANPKTIIKDKYAPTDIKRMVMRVDGVSKYIRQTLNNSAKIKMLDYAEFFQLNNLGVKTDYTIKYKKYEKEIMAKDIAILREKLKEYRLEKARTDKIKPYFVFTNEQLEEILKVRPKTLDELLVINGFGKYKVDKFGKDIIAIINE